MNGVGVDPGRLLELAERRPPAPGRKTPATRPWRSRPPTPPWKRWSTAWGARPSAASTTEPGSSLSGTTSARERSEGNCRPLPTSSGFRPSVTRWSAISATPSGWIAGPRPLLPRHHGRSEPRKLAEFPRPPDGSPRTGCNGPGVDLPPSGDSSSSPGSRGRVGGGAGPEPVDPPAPHDGRADSGHHRELPARSGAVAAGSTPDHRWPSVDGPSQLPGSRTEASPDCQAVPFGQR